MWQYEKITCPLSPAQPYGKCNKYGYISLEDNSTFLWSYLQYKQCNTIVNCFVYDAIEILETYGSKFKVFCTGLARNQVMEGLRNLLTDAEDGWKSR